MKEEESEDIKNNLDTLLSIAIKGVRPPNYMIKFYNSIGRIPLRGGVIIFLLSGFDTIKFMRRAIRGQTDAALQMIYQHRFRPWRLMWGLGEHLWQMSYNCRSVRARGVFTRQTIGFLLGAAENADGTKLTVVSLGSGSASQMLHGVADNHFNSDNVYVILVDNDTEVLERGRKNARSLGIEDIIACRETTVNSFLKEVEPGTLNVIETVGLTDYFDDRRFQRYLRGIYDALAMGGYFLGANISSDEEADFAHKVVCWPRIYYRPREGIIRDLEKAGFKKDKIWTGDCGLYTYWVVRKDA